MKRRRYSSADLGTGCVVLLGVALGLIVAFAIYTAITR